MIEVSAMKVEQLATAKDYGRFQIEPLTPGFGTTVGNAMRRVLLSSLPGAAITSVRIDGVYHEFSDIPEIKEDTTELILNLKEIRLKCMTDGPVHMRLDAIGPGAVTAADITCPPDIEIVNPELHIATLNSSGARLVMELTAERGVGYVPAGSLQGQPIGVILVDAIYTPIRRVNFSVERGQRGQVSECDSLFLEITTDGTVSPDEAIGQAAEILARHFAMLAQVGGKVAVQFDRPTPGGLDIPQQVYDTPIEELELSVRSYNCLKRVGITKVGQILEMSEDDLLGVRNFGRKSLDELQERLAARGFLATNGEDQVSDAEGSGMEDEAASPAAAAPAQIAVAGQVAPEHAISEAESVPPVEQETQKEPEAPLAPAEKYPLMPDLKALAAEEGVVPKKRRVATKPIPEDTDIDISVLSIDDLEEEDQEDLGRKKKVRRIRKDR